MHPAEKLNEQDNARPLAKVTPRLGPELAALLKSEKTLFRAEFDVSGPAKPSKDPCRVATIG